MITLRASTVDSFSLYSDPDNTWISTEEMDARLLGEQGPPTARMALGTAFHAALAGEPAPGFEFDDESVERGRRGLSRAIPEVYGSRVLDVDGVPVCLTGHADWLRGVDMVEVKTSDKPIPPDRYAAALQWRCYCVIFGLSRVTYRLVQLSVDEDDRYRAKAIDDVTMYAYPGVREDVVSCLRQLLAYIEARGLGPLFGRAFGLDAEGWTTAVQAIGDGARAV